MSFAGEDRDEALRLGEDAGRHMTSFVSDCPFLHNQLEMRTAWLEGFSLGRVSLKPGGERRVSSRDWTRFR